MNERIQNEDERSIKPRKREWLPLWRKSISFPLAFVCWFVGIELIYDLIEDIQSNQTSNQSNQPNNARKWIDCNFRNIITVI